MPTSVRSFAKINLGLAIGPPRPDGFHALTTLYQTIALHDIVTVTVKQSAPDNIARFSTIINCSSNNIKVPTDNTNTAVRIIEKALLRLQITAEIDVHIQKNLPVQGGLGAGSANAAGALIALEVELKKALPPPDRLALAAEIGSDVPLFLLGGTVLGLNRGESVFPLQNLPELPCIVVVPPISVSTPKAFTTWDKLLAESLLESPNSLTGVDNSDRLNELSRVLASAFAPSAASGVLPFEQGLAENPLLTLVRTGIENDFEKVVFPLHFSLRALKRLLAGTDSGDGQAVYAALSGSGSALFGLYRNEADAKAARDRVVEYAAKELPGTEVLGTFTLCRETYFRRMLL
jgi:4-diphosphocytidyl-2-C-methyl-D-erythritol kinase